MDQSHPLDLTSMGPLSILDLTIRLLIKDYASNNFAYSSMRIVDVLDEINNNGKPMDEYFFWPDVQVGNWDTMRQI